MISFAVVTVAQLIAFLIILWRNSKQFERILEVSLSHIRAKDLGEVVQHEQLRKSYDVQLAHMKDNLAKEEAQLKKQALVRDELSGQLVDLDQYEIM